MSTQAAPSTSVRAEPQNQGMHHPDLLGADRTHRYRPQRLGASIIGDDLLCRFTVDGAASPPLQVIDVSSTGMALAPAPDLVLAPGTAMEKLTLTWNDREIWRGAGCVVHQSDGRSGRIGIRFTSALFDLSLLRADASDHSQQIRTAMKRHEVCRERLPMVWRAGVASIRRLLEDARDHFNKLETEARTRSSEDTSPGFRTLDAHVRLFWDQWGDTYLGELSAMHAQSRELPQDDIELAYGYAARELLPLLTPCLLHSRAYEKPLGYAGDYKLMQLFLSDCQGPTYYAYFLSYVARQYTLGRALITRERLLRRSIDETVKATKPNDRPVRIASIACGPGIEARNYLRETQSLPQPVDYFFIDQDENALRRCHEEVAGQVVGRHDGNTPLRANHLHFSVRQILKPRDEAEQDILKTTLRDFDLIYSAGLFDYLPPPVAKSLVAKLYDMLAPGGRLLVGNYMDAPDTTWLTEYVLAWHLVYRTPETLKELAADLSPAPASADITAEDVGICIFLDVRKPES